jgi:hypothetical protein
MSVRLRKTAVERRRSDRLRSLPPLAIEFSQIMSEVFGERSKQLPEGEIKALRERGAAIATRILDDMEELRWDQGIAPEMRQLLEATRRKMLTDKRIKGLLKDEGVRAASA